MLDLLERVNRPGTLGFQADMAHTLLYILGYNAPEDAILPPGWDWSDPRRLDDATPRATDHEIADGKMFERMVDDPTHTLGHRLVLEMDAVDP